MKVLLAAAAFFSTALASNYVVHHRLFHPSLPTQPYLERGSISIDPPTPMFVPAADLAEDLSSFAEVLESLETPFDALYQMALQHPGDKSEVLWDFSSVKVCYLNKVAADTILLHFNGDQDPTPFALDYFVSPMAHDGSCPLSKSNKRISPASAMRTFAKNIQSLNTTILLRATETPPLPELKAPPPLTAQGEIVKAIPEKNFLQKYWMYIGAVLLVVLVSGGAEEEAPRRK